jgi:pantoate--beta-alanine ligase
MIICSRIADLRRQVREWRAQGDRIALVPTMGNLHPGHLELVRRAQQPGQRVLVSLFVNPLQFGPREDFAAYPRTPEADRPEWRSRKSRICYAEPVGQDILPGSPRWCANSCKWRNQTSLCLAKRIFSSCW